MSQPESVVLFDPERDELRDYPRGLVVRFTDEDGREREAKLRMARGNITRGQSKERE